MTFFVKSICEFPGAFIPQAGVLVLCCVSMTAICLGFSAIFNSADKASLLSIYLVGFQLPLSGIVLALPDVLVWVCRPFINAYWGWGGYLGSMRTTRLYDAYRVDSDAWIPAPELAVSVLILHFLRGCTHGLYQVASKNAGTKSPKTILKTFHNGAFLLPAYLTNSIVAISGRLWRPL